MERHIEHKHDLSGLVSLSIPTKTHEVDKNIKGNANCYEDGCFHGCIDSCDCVDSCDRVPDPRQNTKK